MYEINLIQRLIDELRNIRPDGAQYNYLGGLNGAIDQEGLFRFNNIEGYDLTEQKLIALSVSDLNNTTEGLVDQLIVAYSLDIEFTIPAELYTNFSEDIKVFQKNLAAKAVDIGGINTILRITLPNKLDETQTNNSKTLMVFDVEIEATAGEDIRFGNETLVEIRPASRKQYDVWVRLDAVNGTGEIVSEYYANTLFPQEPVEFIDPEATEPQLRYTVQQITMADNSLAIVEGSDPVAYEIVLSEVSQESETFNFIKDFDSETGDILSSFTIQTYQIIKSLAEKDQSGTVAARPFQRLADERVSAVDTGAGWGTAFSMLLDVKNWFHREIVKQIANPKDGRQYDLKITMPTFDPYYRRIFLDTVAQASPLGGIIGLSATVQEV